MFIELSAAQLVTLSSINVAVVQVLKSSLVPVSFQNYKRLTAHTATLITAIWFCLGENKIGLSKDSILCVLNAWLYLSIGATSIYKLLLKR